MLHSERAPDHEVRDEKQGEMVLDDKIREEQTQRWEVGGAGPHYHP